MAAASCVAVDAAAKRGVTACRSDAPRNNRKQCGRTPVPIACGLHDDVRTTLTGQLPRPMGFVHRHPQQRRFLQALTRQGGATPGMPRLRPHTGPTQGRAFFVCLNSSLPRRLAHCPLRQLPVRNAQGCRCISHPTLFIGGLVHVQNTFVSQYPRPGFHQGARRMPH